MKNYYLIFLIIVTFFLLDGCAKKEIQTSTLPMFVKVSPYIGLSVDKDKLHFGAVPKGGVSRRMIFLYNNDTFSKQTSLEVQGEIKSLVAISESSFVLSPGENKTIFFSVSVPKNSEYGNYSGNLLLNFARVK